MIQAILWSQGLKGSRESKGPKGSKPGDKGAKWDPGDPVAGGLVRGSLSSGVPGEKGAPESSGVRRNLENPGFQKILRLQDTLRLQLQLLIPKRH